MYKLYKLLTGSVSGEVYKLIYSNEDLNKVKEKLCVTVRDGTPVRELIIAKELPFEFKCAVAIKEEE